MINIELSYDGDYGTYDGEIETDILDGVAQFTVVVSQEVKTTSATYLQPEEYTYGDPAIAIMDLSYWVEEEEITDEETLEKVCDEIFNQIEIR